MAVSGNSAEDEGQKRQGSGRLIRQLWNRKQSSVDPATETTQSTENTISIDKPLEGRDDEDTVEIRKHENSPQMRGRCRSPPDGNGTSRYGQLQRKSSIRSRLLDPTKPVTRARSMLRGMTQKRRDNDSQQESPHRRKNVDRQLPMKGGKVQERQKPRKKISEMFWNGANRERFFGKTTAKKPTRQRSKSIGGGRQFDLPPRPSQKNKGNSKPSRQLKRRKSKPENNHQGQKPSRKVQNKKPSKASHKSRHGNPWEAPNDVIDQAGDHTFLDSVFEAWNAKDSKESMANYEDSRLGDTSVAPERIRTIRRLEIAAKNERCRYEPTARPVPDSVSFEFTLSEDHSDETTLDNQTNAKADLSVIDSVADDWAEIVDAADVISRHYEVDLLDETMTKRRKEHRAFRKALETFRGHAKRLNMDERELFAAVREDPSLLNDHSTFDEDETIDHLDPLLMGIGADLDEGLDRYVEAFEGMILSGIRCAPVRGRDEMSTVA